MKRLESFIIPFLIENGRSREAAIEMRSQTNRVRSILLTFGKTMVWWLRRGVKTRQRANDEDDDDGNFSQNQMQSAGLINNTIFPKSTPY